MSTTPSWPYTAEQEVRIAAKMPIVRAQLLEAAGAVKCAAVLLEAARDEHVTEALTGVRSAISHLQEALSAAKRAAGQLDLLNEVYAEAHPRG